VATSGRTVAPNKLLKTLVSISSMILWQHVAQSSFSWSW